MTKKYKDPSKAELERIMVKAMNDSDVKYIVKLMIYEYGGILAKAVKKRLKK